MAQASITKADGVIYLRNGFVVALPASVADALLAIPAGCSDWVTDVDGRKWLAVCGGKDLRIRSKGARVVVPRQLLV
jgi:hypothetical protein